MSRVIGEISNKIIKKNSHHGVLQKLNKISQIMQIQAGDKQHLLETTPVEDGIQIIIRHGDLIMMITKEILPQDHQNLMKIKMDLEVEEEAEEEEIIEMEMEVVKEEVAL